MPTGPVSPLTTMMPGNWDGDDGGGCRWHIHVVPVVEAATPSLDRRTVPQAQSSDSLTYQPMLRALTAGWATAARRRHSTMIVATSARPPVISGSNLPRIWWPAGRLMVGPGQSLDHLDRRRPSARGSAGDGTDRPAGRQRLTGQGWDGGFRSGGGGPSPDRPGRSRAARARPARERRALPRTRESRRYRPQRSRRSDPGR